MYVDVVAHLLYRLRDLCKNMWCQNYSASDEFTERASSLGQHGNHFLWVVSHNFVHPNIMSPPIVSPGGL